VACRRFSARCSSRSSWSRWSCWPFDTSSNYLVKQKTRRGAGQAPPAPLFDLNASAWVPGSRCPLILECDRGGRKRVPALLPRALFGRLGGFFAPPVCRARRRLPRFPSPMRSFSSRVDGIGRAGDEAHGRRAERKTIGLHSAVSLTRPTFPRWERPWTRCRRSHDVHQSACASLPLES
jgi:hypothetical protein